MKHKRFFRILAIAITLSLLMLAIPATPVLAASVTLSAEVGKIGDKISISGTGFAGSQALLLCFSSQQAAVDDEIDVDITAYEEVRRIVTYTLNEGTGIGTFEGGDKNYFHVPAELTDGENDEMVHGGTYYIYAAAETNNVILTVDKFTVVGIESVDPPEAPVGTKVTIAGVAFTDDEYISLQYDGVDISIASGANKTDRNGDFTCKIDIPPSTAGIHIITAIVEDIAADAQFTVVPTISLSPESGGANDQVTVTGTGFGNEVMFTITFDGDEIDINGDDETDEEGNFESTFTVPSGVEQGVYNIRVVDDDDNTAEAEFSVAANLSLNAGATSDSPGYVGMDLTITGTNFKANYPIDITYASEEITFDTVSGDDGSFSYPITIPAGKAGVHIITATDGTNAAEARFFMEAQAPSAPSLLLPALGATLADWRFDWEDAVDDSLPVTYDFQVATNADFTSPLVSKTGLTASDYTLTGDEKLEKTSEDTPYYWRVRATDAASNVGDWSSASAFYVGSTSSGFPGWLLYTLIGIGVLLAIIFGIWIGRKLTTREEDYWG